MAHNQFELLRQRRFLPFFATQSLGAFNDNIFRQAIIGLLFYMGVSSSERSFYTNLAPAIFILPYFLFSATAGQIAEKLEKSRLIRITTTMEIVIMSLAAVGFLTQNMIVLLIALFSTGVQSALFGPVKYSILPSVLRPEELTGGNGLVEMGTSVSILFGMLLGGLIFQVGGDHGPIVAATAVILCAVAGNLVSRMIPPTDAAAPDLRVGWNPIPESLRVISLVRKQAAVNNAVLGVSWFWFVGTMLTAQLPSYGDDNLGGDAGTYITLLAVFSVATGVGSMLCEKLSARTIEIGLVPLGAFGMTVFLFLLALWQPEPGATYGHAMLHTIVPLVGIGLFAGFYVVPLFALIQSRTPKRELSRVIAAMNIQNAGFIVLAAGLGILALRVFEWSIPTMFLALAIANLLVAAWIFTVVPEFLMRFLSWILVHALYRLRVRGIEEYVPDEGPALLVCNHVSYMDALILAASTPRPVRFVMYYKIFNIPVLRWIFRTAKAIPIAGATENPELMRRAFDEVDAALAEGEIVGIFPEGALTKDGGISPFKTGIERILARRTVPVVPMALRGMWTSMWSRRDGRLKRMRVPRRFRAQIDVIADAPIAGEVATAAVLEAKVRELRGDAP